VVTKTDLLDPLDPVLRGLAVDVVITLLPRLRMRHRDEVAVGERLQEVRRVLLFDVLNELTAPTQVKLLLDTWRQRAGGEVVLDDERTFLRHSVDPDG
jgi:hypothetical protein